MESYLHMGGYAAYVWPAYAIALATLGWMAYATARRLKHAQKLDQ